MRVNKTSEALDSARSEYIEGYVEKNKLIFPTLALVAKEFNVSFSTLRKKAANEGWFKKRKHHQISREEFEMRKQFKGKYSKLAQVSRNSLVFVEHFQTAINREIEAAKRGEKIHTIEDTVRLVTIIQKLQRLSEEANSTLNNLEDSLMSFIE
tara:strand:+ start:121 stop:579 length:459 start_codon:yes stop_codon:yes gene_type:complete